MKNQDEEKNLEKRLSRLEEKVERLERLLSNIVSEETVSEENKKDRLNIIFKETSQTEEKIQWDSYQEKVGDNWLNWLGIGLLLLGVAFLFKYSIDQGWLTPPVRSAFGLAIGACLLISGFNTREGEKLRQILLGGGIAAFYITGFATFQLYSFISNFFGWGFMIIVTLLALSLAIQQNEAILSVLGTAGGLGTPFMLYQGQGSLVMLMGYTCLILAGSAIIYMKKGWKSQLWSMVLGGWLVLMVGWVINIYNNPLPSTIDQWTLQLSVIVAASLFWILPVIRELRRRKNPSKWPEPEKNNHHTPEEPFISNAHVQVLSAAIPIATLFYSSGIWTISEQFWGVIALICSLIIGYTYLPLRKAGLPKLSLVHGFSALILITISLFLLLQGEILLIALALEAFGLRIISFQTGDRNISLSSHLLAIFVGLWMTDRLLTVSVSTIPILHLGAFTDLFVIAIAGLIPQYLGEDKHNISSFYQLAAHIGLLGWFLKEFSILQNGQAYVTIAWGIYALSILFIGFWRDNSRIRFLGMATIFLVVGKLFLIDLNQLSTLLRILLFIGFGTVFLLVGYFLQKKGGEKSTDKAIANHTEESL